MQLFKRYGFGFWIWVMVSGHVVLAQAPLSTPLSINTSGMNQIQMIESGQDSWNFRTTGEDPYLYLQPIQTEKLPRDHVVMSFEYFCPEGISELEIFYGPPIQAADSLSAGSMMKSETWIPCSVHLPDKSGQRWNPRKSLLRLDFGRKKNVRIRIRNLNLRPPNEREKTALKSAAQERSLKEQKAEKVREFYQASYDNILEKIQVDDHQITLQMKRHTLRNEIYYLVEIPLHWSPWKQLIPSSQTPISFENQERTKVIRLLRFQNQRDRLTSRWALATRDAGEEWVFKSQPQYASDLLSPSHQHLDPINTTSLKGMGGVWANAILDELVTLGVKHITVNMLLSHMLSPVQQPGWEAHQYQGTLWWVNPNFVRQHDALIRFATQHQIVVSAILLIGFGDSEFAKQIRHPEAQRAGHYAMPNLTDTRGVLAYGAAIDFLTRRYAQVGDPFGRITNWIMHNEVDYGWVWTNMGRQPMELYMDAYGKSMRLVHLLARRHNPQARVFISLTHHWASQPDPSWKTYAPRKMLEWLSYTGRIEGDFEWALAYHPYPQNLFQPETWKDTLPTHRYDTPMITPKNIEVLDAYMQEPHMRFRGQKLRGLILSEQGYHAPAESEYSQTVQAAAFVYTWHKIRAMKTIEAFHNHRWVDHPNEGGLMLGIRSLPSKEHPYGRKKKAWKVYQQLETANESAGTAFALDVIGVPSFHEIPWKGRIPGTRKVD